MRALAQQNYTEAEIADCLHLVDGGRNVSFRFDLLDRDDRKIGELSDISGSVNYASLAQIKGTAKFTFSNYERREINFLNEQIQPFYMLKMPDGGFAEWSQGIYLITSPTKKFNGILDIRDIDAFDKTIALKQARFRSRHFLSRGQNVVNAITNIASMAGLSKIDITPSDKTLANNREFEAGIGYIEAVNTLLELINYTSVYVTPTGFLKATPYIPPEDREIDYHYRADRNDVMFRDADEALDVFDVPNEVVVTVSNPEMPEPMTAIEQNLSNDSPTSIPQRGRPITKHYPMDDISDYATLRATARRLLIEASQTYRKVSFQTATMPMHTYANTLLVDHKVLQNAGVFSETSWNLELKTGGVMTHEARRLVYLL